MASDAMLVEILKTVTRIEQKLDAMIEEDKKEDASESKSEGVESIFGMNLLGDGGC